ncbi:hypothetical protein MUK42_34816, partial [Musa troglodytarum]
SIPFVDSPPPVNTPFCSSVSPLSDIVLDDDLLDAPLSTFPSISTSSYALARMHPSTSHLQAKVCDCLISPVTTNSLGSIASPALLPFPSRNTSMKEAPVHENPKHLELLCQSSIWIYDAFEQKNDIAKAVEEELEKVMSAYGYEIVQTPSVDIELWPCQQ